MDERYDLFLTFHRPWEEAGEKHQDGPEDGDPEAMRQGGGHVRG